MLVNLVSGFIQIKWGFNMFKEEFVKLCTKNGVSPTSVCVAIGLSNATYTQWTDNSMPRKTTLIKICDYFNLPHNYFDSDKQESEFTDFTYAAYDELTHDLTPVQLEQLKTYAEFLRSQK